jgi:hypothetical protein
MNQSQNAMQDKITSTREMTVAEQYQIEQMSRILGMASDPRAAEIKFAAMQEPKGPNYKGASFN